MVLSGCFFSVSRALYLISKNGSQRLEIGLIVTGRVWLVPVRGFVAVFGFNIHISVRPIPIFLMDPHFMGGGGTSWVVGLCEERGRWVLATVGRESLSPPYSLRYGLLNIAL